MINGASRVSGSSTGCSTQGGGPDLEFECALGKTLQGLGTVPDDVYTSDLRWSVEVDVVGRALVAMQRR